MNTLRLVALIGIAALFTVAGIFHFVRPDAFEKVVPPFLPSRRAIVYISGVAEIAGAIGVLIPATRVWAGWGLIALLVAVFPANVYMAVSPERAGLGIAQHWLWLRLPMQLVLIGWVWWAAVRG